MEPFISIIIPVFNSEKYLEKCISSILNQEYENFEIICINDCSTDNSLNILNSFASIDNRIKIINNIKNLGVGESRNIGIEYAKGKYIHFLDSDDWVDSSLYVKVTNILNFNENIDFITYKHYSYIDKTKKLKKIEKVNACYFNKVIDIENSPECLYKTSQFVWDKIIKKEKLVDIKFNNQVCHEDFEFSIRLYCNTKNIYLLNEYLIYHREHQYSLSKKRLDYINNIKNTTYWAINFVNNTNSNVKIVLLNSIYIIFIIHYFDYYCNGQISFNNLKSTITDVVNMDIIDKCDEDCYKYQHKILRLLLSVNSSIEFNLKYKYKRLLKNLFPTFFYKYWQLKKRLAPFFTKFVILQ